MQDQWPYGDAKPPTLPALPPLRHVAGPSTTGAMPSRGFPAAPVFIKQEAPSASAGFAIAAPLTRAFLSPPPAAPPAPALPTLARLLHSDRGWKGEPEREPMTQQRQDTGKTSLGFILDEQRPTYSSAAPRDTSEYYYPPSQATSVATPAPSLYWNQADREPSRPPLGYVDAAQVDQRLAGSEPIYRKVETARPASRTCKFAGCEQYVVDHGLCVRHGGGKRCLTEGCTSRAKHFGRCWRHGGSIECKIDGCINRAKSRGYCWSHGGGTKCKAHPCEKIAISNGLCWAHGGGKRCIVSGCRKQAYERTRNFCNSHFQLYKKGLLRDEPGA